MSDQYLKLVENRAGSSPVPTTVPAVLVLGMHRAGTSALARALVRQGLAVPGEVVPAGRDNPAGYWEPRSIVELHDDFLHAIGRTWSDPRAFEEDAFAGSAAREARERIRRWIGAELAAGGPFVMKDPRMCRLLPLWDDVMAEWEALHVLLVFRSPLSVVDSLRKRDAFSPEKSLLLWLRHYLEAELATRGFERSWVRFEELASGKKPRVVVEALRAALDSSGLSTANLWGAVESALDPRLIHTRYDVEDTVRGLEGHAWVARTYEALMELAEGREQEGRERLDETRQRVRDADRAFGEAALGNEQLHGERYFWLRQEVLGTHKSVEAQRREIDALRQAYEVDRSRLESVRTEVARHTEAAGEWHRARERDTEDRQSSEDRVLEGLAKERELLERGLESQREALEARLRAVEARQSDLVGDFSGALEGSSRLRGLEDALSGERERSVEIAGRLDSILDLIRGRLEQHHLALLGKSLDATARLESEWRSARAERDEGRTRLAEAEKELDRSARKFDDLLGRYSALERELRSLEDERLRALRERDARTIERDRALAALEEQRERTADLVRERDALWLEKGEILRDLESVVEGREAALCASEILREELRGLSVEAGRLQQENEVLRAENERRADDSDGGARRLAAELEEVVRERDGARQEIELLKSRSSWRWTAPFRAAVRALRSSREFR